MTLPIIQWEECVLLEMCIIRKRAIRPISYIIFTLFYHIKEATSMLAPVLTPSSYMAILIIKLTDS